jgi:carbon monoxide dehydrogenase subunit G
MSGMSTSMVIARPAEEAFAFLLNPRDSAPRMDPAGGGLVLMTPDGPPGPGTTFVFRQRVMGRTTQTKTHLTAVEPDRRIEFDAEIGPMRPRCALTFEPVAEGTLVTFRGDSNPRGPLKVFTPLMDRMGQKSWAQRLDRMKEVLESTNP